MFSIYGFIVTKVPRRHGSSRFMEEVQGHEIAEPEQEPGEECQVVGLQKQKRAWSTVSARVAASA